MQADRSRLEAFEIWICRRTEKISWKDKKTNEKIFRMDQEGRKIFKQYGIKSTSGWVALWHDGTPRDISEGRMLGKSTTGKKRIQLVGDLSETKNYADLKKAAEGRSVWRTIKRGCHKPAQ